MSKEQEKEFERSVQFNNSFNYMAYRPKVEDKTSSFVYKVPRMKYKSSNLQLNKVLMS